MDIVKELRGGADDPMWADHCEMPKAVAKAAADEIDRLRAVRDAAVDVVSLMDDTAKQDSGASQAFRRLESAIMNSIPAAPNT